MAESSLEVAHNPFSKLKTEQKPASFQLVREDLINSVKTYLESGARVSFGDPIKLPLIRRRTHEIEDVADQCSSSRLSHQNSSQLCIRDQIKGQLKLLEQPSRQRVSSFGRPLVNRSRLFRRLKESSLELIDPTIDDTEIEIQNHEQKRMPKPALPRIIRTKYLKEPAELCRIKSQRNVHKQQSVIGTKAYQLGRVVGRGSSSVVRVAKTPNDKLFAMKTYDKSKLVDSNQRQNVRKEVQILGRVNHPNIIKFVEAIETTISINIVTQLVDSPSLQVVLASTENNRMTESSAKPLFRQLLEAVKYLHDKNICHRDIKIENILLTASQLIKLIDFGFSTEYEGKLDTFCGTPSYIAPEIISKGGYLGQPADIWSCGIVLYRLLSGNYPFRGINEKSLYSKISRGKFKLTVPMSNSARDLLTSVLTVEPSDRPSAAEILLHPWLTDNHCD